MAQKIENRVYRFYGTKPMPGDGRRPMSLYKRGDGKPMRKSECRKDAEKHGCKAVFVEW